MTAYKTNVRPARLDPNDEWEQPKYLKVGATGELAVDSSGSVVTTSAGEHDPGNTTAGTALSAYGGTKFIDEDNLAGAVGSPVPAAPSDTYLGTRHAAATFAGFGIDALSDQLGQGYAIWEDENLNVILVETTAFAGSGAFYDPAKGAVWGRIAFQNRSASPATFISSTTWKRTAPGLFMFPAGGNIQANFPAGVVKAVSTATQPDGDFVNAKADGSAFATAAALGVSGQYTSAWVDTDGWGSIELTVATDQISASAGIEIQFTDDTGAATPIVRSKRFYTFTAVEVAQGFATFRFKTRLDGFRVVYTNGATAQGSFFLETVLRVGVVNPEAMIESAVDSSAEVVATRAALLAKSRSTSEYGNIRRGSGGGLDVGIVQHEAKTPLSACDNWTTAQVTGIGTGSASRLDTTQLTNRTSIEIRALNSNGNSGRIYIGPSSGVNSANGRELVANEPVTIEIRPGSSTQVWAIANSNNLGACVTQIAETV